MKPVSRSRGIKIALFVLVALCALSVPPVIMQRGIRLEHERHAHVTDAIRALGTQLDHYKSTSGAYPTSDQGLRALGVAPKDPWQSDYVYRCPGNHNRAGYDLFSAGLDQKPDTADDDWGE